MKKILVVLLCLLVVTGCDSKKVNMDDYDAIFNTFLNRKTSLVNNYSVGYKYYLPTGVRVVESKDYNEKLYYNGYNYNQTKFSASETNDFFDLDFRKLPFGRVDYESFEQVPPQPKHFGEMIDLARQNNLIPVLYLESQNIMDLPGTTERFESMGVRVIRGLDELE